MAGANKSFDEVACPSVSSSEVISDEQDPSPLYCSTDAGHPRFQKRPKKVEMCYCPSCDEYILDSIRDREEHFANNHHLSNGKCQHCTRDLYSYKKGSQYLFHHICPYGSPVDSASSIGEPCVLSKPEEGLLKTLCNGENIPSDSLPIPSSTES